MNDLISKSKILEWLDIEIDLSEGSDPVLKADRWAFRRVKKEVESGRLNADPIPLPTIKPGDRVYHKRFKARGTVKRLSKSGKRAYVVWDRGAPSFVDLKSLEVSHD